MIDLRRTRQGLLAEIDAPDLVGNPLTDITDPRVATANTHVRLWGRGRDDLFPLLKLALSERFRAVPRLNLTLDLLMPLKNAIGNAYKHGNAADPAKAVCVEIVLTGKGAFIAVTDEGPGFDVTLTFQRFQEQQNYFEHYGIGFRNLHRAKSTVSYENGGRTVLLCYRPSEGSDHASSSGSASAGDSTGVTAGSGRALPKVLDAGWMQTWLTAGLPEFADGRLEPCRVYAIGGRAGDDCGNRYVLRAAGHDGGPPETRILTGRLHSSEAAARADFEAAARLHEAKVSTKIPRPVARLAAEPCLVFYDFDSWLTLGEFLTYQFRLKAFRGGLRALRHVAGKFGRLLARLHTSQVVLPGLESDPVRAELHALVARAEATLQSLPSGPELVNRFRFSMQRVQQRTVFNRQQTLAPIHGALGWDCIYYGVDGELYLYRFESCRRSDPRLDLGGFAADLLCFALATYDDAAYRLCNSAFLGKYNSMAAQPVCEDDLEPYIVLALCRRLQCAEPRTKAGTAQLLAALDAVLCDSVVTSSSRAQSPFSTVVDLDNSAQLSSLRRPSHS